MNSYLEQNSQNWKSRTGQPARTEQPRQNSQERTDRTARIKKLELNNQDRQGRQDMEIRPAKQRASTDKRAITRQPG